MGDDNNGNTLTKSNASGTTQYGWDFENRLTQAVVPGVGTVSFRYDPFGRRIQKSGPNGTVNYVYDGANSADEVDGSGNLLAHYAQGTGIDEPLSEVRSGTTGFYEADGLGSITSLSGSTGSVSNSYTYDSFGNASLNGSFVNPYRYTARDFDSETGLQYSRARYYENPAGRFASEDPIQFTGGANFYRYVGNSPTNWTDALGLCPPDPPPSRLKICAKNYYGVGTATTRGATLILGVPFPKGWVFLPRSLGSGRFTNLLSWLSLGMGTAASGSNVFRIAGRVAGPVAIASVVIDASALTMCETDYVPNFIVVINKYDPF